MRMTSRVAGALLSLLAVLLLSGAVAHAAPGVSLDSTFGDRGVVSGGQGAPGYREAAGLAIAVNGDLLVAGVDDSSAAVARYLPEGELDPGYGDDGVAHAATVGVVPAFSLEAVRGVNGLAVDPSGRALLLWQGAKLTRLTAEGRLDSSFGAGGTAALSSYHFNDLTVLFDGSVLLAGYAYGSPFMVAAKLRPDGSLDQTFGHQGYAKVEIGPSETNAGARRVAVSTNGKIVLAGFSHGRPALVRLLPNGTPDRSFGNEGRVLAPRRLRGEATALNLETGGAALVSCRCARTRSAGTLLPILRFDARGVFDAGFSKASRSRAVRHPIRPRNLIRTSGRIVLVGGGTGPAVRLFTGSGKPLPRAALASSVPRDRLFGVFAALRGKKPVVAWTPRHPVGAAEVRLARFVVR
jgi:uncharacterized delta-60 repeat protein